MFGGLMWITLVRKTFVSKHEHQDVHQPNYTSCPHLRDIINLELWKWSGIPAPVPAENEFAESSESDLYANVCEPLSSPTYGPTWKKS